MDLDEFEKNEALDVPDTEITDTELDDLTYEMCEESIEEPTEIIEEQELESYDEVDAVNVENLFDEYEDLDNIQDDEIGSIVLNNEIEEADEIEDIGDVSSSEEEIDYDEIYEQIQNESLRAGFEDMPIDVDETRLENALYHFEEEIWVSQPLEQQKDSISELADYVSEVVGLDNPPAIDYYYNAEPGEYGAYDANSNVLRINEYTLDNSKEAADTVAHELWHAHQHECASNPQNSRDYQYGYNFANYISPDLDQDAYENQLVEAEARAFAAQFKDRLSMERGQ